MTIPNLIEVSSSNIKALGHNGNTLFVEFKSAAGPGAVWSYTPVTKQQFDDLKAAPSIGAHFTKWIKNNSAISAAKVHDPAAAVSAERAKG